MVELIIYHRPYSSKIRTSEEGNPIDTSSIRSANPKIKDNTSILDIIQALKVPQDDSDPQNYFTTKQNPNDPITPKDPIIDLPEAGAQGLRIDLKEDIQIPLTYTILDIREPDKRKTSWSKTITLPGTKNNNRIFGHIYDLSKDGWVTIGNYNVYQGFNPNIKLDILLVKNGLTQFRGALQLKKITKNDDDINYEVVLNGDLTGLFFDLGNSKLSDLPLTEFNHDWSKNTIVNSWSGILTKNDKTYTNVTSSFAGGYFTFEIDTTTGRVKVTTTFNHNLAVGDWVRIRCVQTINSSYDLLLGHYSITEVPSSKVAILNTQFPIGLVGLNGGGSTLYMLKEEVNGEGYVYPMISWGDEYDYNSFPVTSFVPGLFIKGIWDKIMELTNSRYQSNFLNTQFFKRLFIIQKKMSYGVSPAEISERQFRVGTIGTYTTNCNAKVGGVSPGQYGSINGYEWALKANTTHRNPVSNDVETWGSPFRIGKIEYSLETGGSGTGSYCDGNCDGYNTLNPVNNWDNNTFVWKVKKSGMYNLATRIPITAWIDMHGFEGGSLNGTASFQPGVQGINYYPGYHGEGGGVIGPMQDGSNSSNITGIFVSAVMKRKRNGATINVSAPVNVQFRMDPNQGWGYPFSQTGWAGNIPPGWAYWGRYQPSTWINKMIDITNIDKYFKEGDEVWVDLSFYCQARNSSSVGPGNKKYAIGFYETNNNNGPGGFTKKLINGDFYFRMESPAYIYNQAYDTSSENSELEIAKVVPEMSCKDFITNICKMFNLHIMPDKELEKYYYIEPRDDFYVDGSGYDDIVDWTDKIDNSSIEISPMGELLAKKYTFENKAESDFWNKKFKTDRSTREYMQYSKEIKNDFLKNELKISTTFGSSVMINNPEGSDVVMPAILQKEDSGAFKPVTNSLPRILLWGGLKPYASSGGHSMIDLSNPIRPGAKGWELLSALYTTVTATQSGGDLGVTSSNYTLYPYAGTVDSPQDPQYDINWFNMEEGDFVYWDKARWTDNNLYNAYWRNMITELSDPSSLLLQAKFDLKATDIYNLDFRKIDKIGTNIFRLQKVIDYSPTSDSLTKCELLKIKTQTRFRPTSVWNGEPIDVSWNYDRAVSIKETLLPPRKLNFAGAGYINNTTNFSNGTVTMNGKGNFVGKMSKNVKINGDECSVGDNCINIHISSGSGIAIAGGLSNVTVIGTNKRIINESNVTYINGIRYKNGIAVSKASIIDAGEDIVLPQNGNNTICNIVDAGEDIVIPIGSSSIEDIIDAGTDAILPDIPELGLSTTTTPQARTNYLGASGQVYGTMSTAEVVRLNRSNIGI